MDAQEVLAQLEPMREEMNRLLDKEINKLLTSRAIDFEADEDYGIPKIILHVALGTMAEQYRPFSPIGRTIARNLAKF